MELSDSHHLFREAVVGELYSPLQPRALRLFPAPQGARTWAKLLSVIPSERFREIPVLYLLVLKGVSKESSSSTCKIILKI